MKFSALDWCIVGAVYASMVGGVWLLRPFMRSVADFLAAGRTAGRYMLSVSQGVAALGAISVVGFLEQNYVAGFSLTWWGLSTAVVVLLITVTGFVVYRFRETRCLTLAEFFERRYSRRFRIFMGLLAFLSGIINFGIFPAVGARFFIHFMGLPGTLQVGPATIDTFPLVMAVLLLTSLVFVFSGGQVTVIISDFIQGIFVNIVFLAIVLFLLFTVSWDQVFTALGTAPPDASLINPFHTSQLRDFNFWYFLIGTIGVVYVVMSWQGTQGYNASAESAHEAKMGAVLSNWRGLPHVMFMLVVPIVAYTVLHHPDFAPESARVAGLLATVESDTIANQLRVPAVLNLLLPTGLVGAFAAVMLTAFISTHDTYLHSWGSIFIQDVVMPFRKTPFSPRAHMRALRLSIAGVAAFIFGFSLLFRQSQYIFLFFAITGAIFAGGSGAVLIGGLYWKRGTTPAAWAAMITGSTIAVSGIVIHQLIEDFPINGQVFWGIAMAASTLVYVSVSLLGRGGQFDLDRLLARGAAAGDPDEGGMPPTRGWRALGLGRGASRPDRAIYVATYAWIGVWTLVFAAGTVWNLTHDVPDSDWERFWRFYVWVQTAAAFFVVIWFTIGGVRDIRRMLSRLADARRDDTDDGWVSERPTGG